MHMCKPRVKFKQSGRGVHSAHFAIMRLLHPIPIDNYMEHYLPMESYNTMFIQSCIHSHSPLRMPSHELSNYFFLQLEANCSHQICIKCNLIKIIILTNLTHDRSKTVSSEYQVSKQSNISVAEGRQTEEYRTSCQRNHVHETRDLCTHIHITDSRQSHNNAVTYLNLSNYYHEKMNINVLKLYIVSKKNCTPVTF